MIKSAAYNASNNKMRNSNVLLFLAFWLLWWFFSTTLISALLAKQGHRTIGRSLLYFLLFLFVVVIYIAISAIHFWLLALLLSGCIEHQARNCTFFVFAIVVAIFA